MRHLQHVLELILDGFWELFDVNKTKITTQIPHPVNYIETCTKTLLLSTEAKRSGHSS